MKRRAKVFLIIYLVTFLASFLVQAVFQFLCAEKSIWGWKSWMAARNCVLECRRSHHITLLTLRLNEQRRAMAVATGCTVLCFLLGTNHLFDFIANPAAQFHWPPLVLNYVGFAFGFRLLLASRISKQ